MPEGGRFLVLGVGVDAIGYKTATERVVNAAKEPRGFACSAVAVHGVMTGVLDPAHCYRLNGLDLVVPDGQPVRWALNLVHGTRLAERVYGPTLMLEVCARAAEEALPIFLYGSTNSVLRALEKNLVERFPGLMIAGTRASRFRRLSEVEKEEMVREIRESGAAIVFVGLGCPRQEVWAFENRDALGLPIVAVGAAFDFHAGTLRQAPEALQRRGLEWLYRLAQEPRRLYRRYLYLNPLYLGLLAAQMLGIWKVRAKAKEPIEELRYG